jgi:hypothetical protein
MRTCLLWGSPWPGGRSGGTGPAAFSDPTKATTTQCGVLNDRGIASRWTFYIGRDGRISYIDKAVRPATFAGGWSPR